MKFSLPDTMFQVSDFVRVTHRSWGTGAGAGAGGTLAGEVMHQPFKILSKNPLKIL